MTWFFDDTPVCLFVWAENAYTYKHLQLVEWIGGRRKLESGPPALSCSLRTLWLALKESEREGQRLFFLQPLSNIVIPLPLRCRIRFSFSFFFKKPCDVGFVLCFFFVRCCVTTYAHLVFFFLRLAPSLDLLIAPTKKPPRPGHSSISIPYRIVVYYNTCLCRSNRLKKAIRSNCILPRRSGAAT